MWAGYDRCGTRAAPASQSLPPRGSCRAATEGEGRARRRLTATHSPSACGISPSGGDLGRDRAVSRLNVCWLRPMQPHGLLPADHIEWSAESASQSLPRGGAVAQRLRGRAAPTPADRDALPPLPTASPPRGAILGGIERYPPQCVLGTSGQPRGLPLHAVVQRIPNVVVVAAGSWTQGAADRDATLPAPPLRPLNLNGICRACR